MTSFDIDNLRPVISHTLQILGKYSTAAENLLLITAALQAENFNSNQKPGLGVYKIDRASHIDIWDNYLMYDPDLASTVRGVASEKAFLQDPHLELVTNQGYATAIAWLIYQSSELILPPAEDIQSLTACWAKHFSRQENMIVCRQAFIHSCVMKIGWDFLTEPRALEA